MGSGMEGHGVGPLVKVLVHLAEQGNMQNGLASGM
jgi:hypothetical protein